jgi:hypothetical protein
VRGNIGQWVETAFAVTLSKENRRIEGLTPGLDPDIHLAFLQLGCALISLGFLG